MVLNGDWQIAVDNAGTAMGDHEPKPILEEESALHYKRGSGEEFNNCLFVSHTV